MKIIEFIKEYNEILIFILIIGTYLILDYYLRNKNKKLKENIYEKYKIIGKDIKNISDINNITEEDQLNYYKNKNIISFLRFGTFSFILISYILHKFPTFFNIFAIAVGTIIIVFKEIILSFVAFFYVSTQNKIGDDIILTDGKDGIRGEIIYVNILNVGLVGIDANGEHNGQFYKIPNYKFFIETIKKEDISLHKYKREDIILYYKKGDFNIEFNEFSDKLIKYLEQNLSKKTINNVGDFKTFIGYKYKIRFQYEKDYLQIKISFIVKPREVFEVEKGIFAFVEKFKK